MSSIAEKMVITASLSRNREMKMRDTADEDSIIEGLTT